MDVFLGCGVSTKKGEEIREDDVWPAIDPGHPLMSSASCMLSMRISGLFFNHDVGRPDKHVETVNPFVECFWVGFTELHPGGSSPTRMIHVVTVCKRFLESQSKRFHLQLVVVDRSRTYG